MARLADLAGNSLDSFRMEEMTEVYSVNEDGRKTKVIGYFKHAYIAEAFATSQSGGSGYNRTREVLVITSDTLTYLVEDQEPLELFNDEEEALRLKQLALMKLTPAEQKLLGH